MKEELSGGTRKEMAHVPGGKLKGAPSMSGEGSAEYDVMTNGRSLCLGMINHLVYLVVLSSLI